MRKDVPLAVEVPSPDRDKPAWVKVGVIAAVGFVVGIAWPRVVGVRLGPSAPGESSAAASSASGAAAGRAPDAPPASVAAKTTGTTPAPSASAPAEKASTPAPAAATAAAPPKITVTKGNVLSCKTTDGEKKTGKECGPVAGLDLVVKPRVQSIATCAGVEGQTGKLSLVVNADFNTGRFWYDVSKASSVPNLDAISSCLKTSFHNTSVDKGVPHEHARYTVSYTAMLTSSEGGAPASAAKAKTDKNADKPAATEDEAPAPAPAKAAAGEAAVAWEVALVRDQPKVGSVVARLPRGTKVKLGSMKEGWYSIKFGDDFGTDGWVYRGAVGR